MDDLLSIVTTSLNNAEGLRRTIESVRAQRVRPCQFLVVDGGSSDGSVELLRESANVDRWISEPDRGISDAFNKGARLATGHYLLYLNSGDELHDPDVLADVLPRLAAARDSGAGRILYGDALVVDGAEARRHRGDSAGLARDNTICHQAAFVPRPLQLRLPYDGRLRIGMDYDLWLRAEGPDSFARIERTICRYHLGGISSSPAWGEHSIAIHRILLWINRREKISSKHILTLLRDMLAFRAKKATQRIVGERAYRWAKRRAGL